ncbi:hypothetical protein BGW38_004531 [Lunasporangiospora selenospora]|uniref:Kinesin-like protein n=1 Tax=Lunasporangiospora selenospora TaxID=979761 RepID=A0A9P6FQ11_9FUNG|nr:hypothetical protein BGW38_004531 [Lunasporangiospora selenospora]
MIGSNNEQIYGTSVKNLVQSAMEGYNGTVFAYGQTSSGKTYTMSGNEQQPGITPRAIEDIFKYIRENPDREFLLRVSYLEIYNESIRDLLSPESNDLRIHEDKRRGVYVSPLKEEIVTTPSQVMRIIERGDHQRHVSSTDFNAHSSRSHSIFQIVIESRDRSSTNGSPTLRKPIPGAKSSLAVRVSQLNLIDLAGSEKATTDVERRKEGAFINKSLLTLGTVISRLTEEKGAGHIPYRDSKLTRILQSSLNGSARVSVICTTSPSYLNVEESHNTLKFAARVKKVVTRAQTNQVMDDKALLEKYRREISELKAQLTVTVSQSGESSSPSGLADGANGAISKEQQAEVEQLLETERQRHQEEISEMSLARNALKERIDHLTKLILTSQSISTKATASESPVVRNTVETSADGTVFEFPKEVEMRLTHKDAMVKQLQSELEAQHEKTLLLTAALEKAARGESVDFEKTLGKTELEPRERFLMEKRASVMSINSLNADGSPTDAEDLAAILAMQQKNGHAPPPRDRTRTVSGLLPIEDGDEDQDESLMDTPWSRAELKSLRQAKRELEIVVMDQERKIEEMVAFEDSDEFRNIILELEAQREKIVLMEEEREGFRSTVHELRSTIRKLELRQQHSGSAGAGGNASGLPVETLGRIKDLEMAAQRERRHRLEEQSRHMGKITSLEAELTMLRAELSVRDLAGY